jgi:hypothetical protein
MPAVSSIPDGFREQLADVATPEIQKLDEELAQHCEVRSDWTSKKLETAERMALEWVEIESRHEKTNPVESNFLFRAHYQKSFKCANVRDRNDEKWLNGLLLSNSELMMDMKYGWSRRTDLQFVKACFADAYVGPRDAQHTQVVPFPSENIIPANFSLSGSGPDTGVTRAKIARLEEMFRDMKVVPEREELYLAVSARQVSLWQQEVDTAINPNAASYFDDWLKDRKKKLGGLFNVIVTEVPRNVVAPELDECVAFSRRAFITSASTVDFKADILVDQNHDIQVVGYADKGFGRRYDKLVIKVMADRQV